MNAIQLSFVRSTVKNYIFIDNTELLTNEIQKLYNSLCSNSDAEKFYSQFYKLIVMDAKKYFNSLDFPMCTLLALQTKYWPITVGQQIMKLLSNL